MIDFFEEAVKRAVNDIPEVKVINYSSSNLAYLIYGDFGFIFDKERGKFASFQINPTKIIGQYPIPSSPKRAETAICHTILNSFIYARKDYLEGLFRGKFMEFASEKEILRELVSLLLKESKK